MRALLIDADPSAAHAVARMLAASGIIADQTNSGREALQLVQRDIYDVVLLDPRLLDPDGYAVLARIYAATGTPVLALACSAQTRARALAAGATDCMVKPFERTELIARLKALAQGGHPVCGAAAD